MGSQLFKFFQSFACKGGVNLAIKKNTSKAANKKEKQLEETVNTLEEKIRQIENAKQLEERIQEKKESIKDALQNQLISQNKFGQQFEDMVNDYLYLVELKERLQNDIDINGIRYKTIGGNGFMSYKPNESCERLLKTNAQMLTILEKLNLKAPEEKPEEGEGDDLL